MQMASKDVPEMSIKNALRVEPVLTFDNVYYVGDRWVPSYA